MCKFLFQLIMIGALWLSLSPHAQAGGAEKTTKIEILYNEIYAIERSQSMTERDRINAIISSYEKYFRPRLDAAVSRTVDTTDLDFILRAAYIAAFYTFDPRYLMDVRTVLNELERRQSASDSQRITMHRIFIGYREFDSARRYLVEHSNLGLEPVPDIGELKGKPEDGLLIYRAGIEKFELVPEHIAVASGTVLVVVAHPLCNFSRRAMEAIKRNTKLSSAIHSNVVWLAPPSMDLHFDDLQRWNRKHPAIQVLYSNRPQDWPMIQSWATPQFYLLKNGRVLDMFSGWPKDGNESRLTELLVRGGLLTKY